MLDLASMLAGFIIGLFVEILALWIYFNFRPKPPRNP